MKMSRKRISIKKRIARRVFWGIMIMIFMNYVIYWILSKMDFEIKILWIDWTDLCKSIAFTFINLFGYSGMRAVLNRGGKE